jgi:hypothetical protein
VPDHPDAKDIEREDALGASGAESQGRNELTKEAAPPASGEHEAPPPQLSQRLRERLERLDGWKRDFLEANDFRRRLELLVDFGLTDYDIARAVPNAKPRSVRRWRTEGPPVTRLAERWDPIDDLRALICFLLSDGSYDEEGIVAWLRSRQPELESRRPLDVLGAGDFDAVQEAAERVLRSVEAEPSELVPLPRRPAKTRLSSRHRLA